MFCLCLFDFSRNNNNMYVLYCIWLPVFASHRNGIMLRKNRIGFDLCVLIQCQYYNYFYYYFFFKDIFNTGRGCNDIESHFQQYFSYVVAVSFIGGGNRSTRRKKPLSCRKSPTNFITLSCIEYSSPWAAFEH